MSKIPYASSIYSLMHTMVFIRENIAHVIGCLSWYILDLENKHWKIVSLSTTEANYGVIIEASKVMSALENVFTLQ
ncbi:hypothetical protein EJ110_NYTH26076 [Nymphaea thermarum]|nr:hypothetical protein EJ110_NYTH26076 [Nymphaea thermarum]